MSEKENNIRWNTNKTKIKLQKQNEVKLSNEHGMPTKYNKLTHRNETNK